MSTERNEYLNAGLLKFCVDIYDHFEENHPEVEEKTEESVTSAFNIVAMPPRETLRRRPRYMAATRLVRVLRKAVDLQG